MTKTTNSKIIVLYGFCCLHKKEYLHWANGTKVFSEQGTKIKFPSCDCTKIMDKFPGRMEREENKGSGSSNSNNITPVLLGICKN